MFVGCSEVRIIAVVTHVQHIEIIRAFCMPGRDLINFSLPGGREKIVGL